jgi:hypothetical protein
MNQDKKTSIKCHHPPGGSSNFSFNWGNNVQDTNSRQTIRSTSKTKYNIINGLNNVDAYSFSTVKPEEKENMNINLVPVTGSEDFEVPDAKKQTTISSVSSIKTNYQSGKAKLNIFNGDSADEKSTSIRVNHAPGGKSTVCFGNDSTSYEQYRRK